MTKEEKKEYNKKYRETHKEQIKQYHAIWRSKNREHINQLAREKYNENSTPFKKSCNKYRLTHQEKEKIRHHNYKINNREKCATYERNKRKEPLYRLKVNIRTLINGSFKRCKHKKNNKAEQILGCTIEEFINYLQKQFKEGMTLENHGEWHIDHIIPISSAKTEEEIFKLNHYTNLQPLWAEENLKKGKYQIGG